jgi:serine/threonine protein kinase
MSINKGSIEKVEPFLPRLMEGRASMRPIEIGKGSYGTVYISQADSSKVVKKIAIADFDSVVREIIICRYLAHRSVIRHTSIDVGPDHVLITMVRYDMTLRDYIRQIIGREDSISDRIAKYQAILPLMRDLGAAILYIHRRRVIHADINLKNILVRIKEDEVGLVVTDFNISIFMPNPPLTNIVQTINYRAPEVYGLPQLIYINYGYEIDIWSIGCVLYEMVTGERLFEDIYGDSLKNAYVRLFRPTHANFSIRGALSAHKGQYGPLPNVFGSIAQGSLNRAQMAAQLASIRLDEAFMAIVGLMGAQEDQIGAKIALIVAKCIRGRPSERLMADELATALTDLYDWAAVVIPSFPIEAIEDQVEDSINLPLAEVGIEIIEAQLSSIVVNEGKKNIILEKFYQGLEDNRAINYAKNIQMKYYEKLEVKRVDMDMNYVMDSMASVLIAKLLLGGPSADSFIKEIRAKSLFQELLTRAINMIKVTNGDLL